MLSLSCPLVVIEIKDGGDRIAMLACIFDRADQPDDAPMFGLYTTTVAKALLAFATRQSDPTTRRERQEIAHFSQPQTLFRHGWQICKQCRGYVCPRQIAAYEDKAIYPPHRLSLSDKERTIEASNTGKNTYLLIHQNNEDDDDDNDEDDEGDAKSRTRGANVKSAFLSSEEAKKLGLFLLQIAKKAQDEKEETTP